MYCLPAYTARRAERAQEHQNRELHAAEQTRAREHEQLVAGIKRCERWLDDCCRPLYDGLSHVVNTRGACCEDIVVLLEKSNPDLVASMVSLCVRNPLFVISEDGRATFMKKHVWEGPEHLDEGLTRAFGAAFKAAPSVVAFVISYSDAAIAMSQPYNREFPVQVMKVLEADPSADVAVLYRRYVTVVLMPLLNRVSAILNAHSSSMEWPSKVWLREKYPAEIWDAFANQFFGIRWISYAAMFERIVDEWKDGVFSSVCPSAGMPVGGLAQSINQSRLQGEAKLGELIGVSKPSSLLFCWLIFCLHIPVLRDVLQMTTESEVTGSAFVASMMQAKGD